MIKLHDVSKQFGSTIAVNKLTMNFYSNEIFCLLGHNGAGKTTLINLLTGIVPVNEGKI